MDEDSERAVVREFRQYISSPVSDLDIAALVYLLAWGDVTLRSGEVFGLSHGVSGGTGLAARLLAPVVGRDVAYIKNVDVPHDEQFHAVLNHWFDVLGANGISVTWREPSPLSLYIGIPFLDGQRKGLLEVLQARFGPVDERVRAQILGSNYALIDEMAMRIHSASTVDEVVFR